MPNPHNESDTDTSKQAVHHSLGFSANQAMPGNAFSTVLGSSITGSRTDGTALQNLLFALETLGLIENNSTS